MTRLNLLPWREMRRREQDRQLLTIGIGAWVVMGLAVFYAHFHVTGMIDAQNKRNEFLNAEIKKVEEQIKEACHTFRAVLTAAGSFGGEEVLEIQ